MKKLKRIGPMLKSKVIPKLPCYHRALVTAGLIEKSMSIPQAYEIFLWVGSQPEVLAARERVVRAKRVQVTVPFAVTVAALALLGKEELRNISLRRLYQRKVRV